MTNYNELSSSVMLEQLFIGYVDGETEAQEENFEDLFYTKNSKYKEILMPNKFIITGRKGTGKTILAKYIEKKSNYQRDKFCLMCKLNDFKQQKLKDLDYRDLNQEELCSYWRWAILIELSQIIIGCHPTKSKLPNTSAGKLKRFLKGKYENKLVELTDYSTSESVKKISKLGADLGFHKLETGSEYSFEKFLQLEKHYKPKEYYNLLEQLSRFVIKALNTQKQIFLIYDDLDELEGRIDEDKFYRKLIVSMMETVKDLNFEIRKNTRSGSKIIMLIRDDIIDSLQSYSTNLNKLVTEAEVNLYWMDNSYNSPEKHPLMDLVLTKIQNSNSTLAHINKKKLYKSLFPKKIQDKEAIEYLLEHSFGRPRDIIRYLNIIKEEYPAATVFQPNFFKECGLKYSGWFYNELVNELSIHENSEFVNQSLELIKNFKKRTFDYNMICGYYNRNKELYPAISNIKDSIKCMYKFGVIGNSWMDGMEYKYSWGYRKDADNNPDYTKSFVVHFGLRKKFSI